MDYQEYKPHIHLAEFIECYWYARSDRPPFREKESLIPDGTIEMMFNFGDDYFQVNENDLTEIKGSHVIGIRNRSLSISQPGKQHFFCIRFKLGGTYPFFRLPVDLFAGRFYSLDVLLGNQLKELKKGFIMRKIMSLGYALLISSFFKNSIQEMETTCLSGNACRSWCKTWI